MTDERLIDSHAHVDFKDFAADFDGMLERARAAGVERVIAVGTDLQTSRRALELARAHPCLSAAAGVHPHEAHAAVEEHFGELQALWAEPEVVAVGETGLDYYYDFSPREQQQQVFRRQLIAAAAVKLPIIIHIRDAFDDAFALIQELGVPSGGVLHCFTGGPAECERALSLGLHISFSGIATFPKATELRQAAAMVPGDRILVETDAPYLAPAPLRGKRNEPAYVVHTARALAAARGESFATFAARTRDNTRALFRLP